MNSPTRTVGAWQGAAHRSAGDAAGVTAVPPLLGHPSHGYVGTTGSEAGGASYSTVASPSSKYGCSPFGNLPGR